MKKYLSSLVCGFGAGVIQIVPVAKSFTCCLIVPAAAVLAIILDRKANNLSLTEKIPMQKGLMIGLVAGLFAAFFGSTFELLITFITKSNDIIFSLPELQKMIGELPLSPEFTKEISDLFYLMADEIKESGFSVIYTVSVLFNNFITSTIFGLLGGLIGTQILNSRISRDV
ncbi:MAG: hypothetical protein KKA84_06670 [Bacteroidetes bacterium]|nr:hypothetical protein [Bacteroidota bacterium]